MCGVVPNELVDDLSRRIRVVIAHGDLRFLADLAQRLQQVSCTVARCKDAPALARCLRAHRLGDARADAVVADLDLPRGRGLGPLTWLGTFDEGVPVVVTARVPSVRLRRAAIARGATLVVNVRDLDGIARGLRHVVAQHRRWRGPWVSTDLLSRSDGPDADPQY